MTPSGLAPRADANTICHLAGKAIAGELSNVARSAAPYRVAKLSRGATRLIDLGVLGPAAVSVTYGTGAHVRTVPVLPGIGAYLIVRAVHLTAHDEEGGWSSGTPGDLAPSGAITAFTYRIDGKLCQRGQPVAPWEKSRIVDPCPWPVFHPNAAEIHPPNLHQPLRTHLEIRHGTITAVDVSFTAPYPVNDATHEYALQIPDLPCHGKGVRGFDGITLDRNVKAGETLRVHAIDPFTQPCAHGAMTIEGVYRGRDGLGNVIVGTIAIYQPPGTRVAGPLLPSRRRRR